MKLTLAFQIASVIISVAAGYFYWNGDSDLTFAAAVVAAAAFFLSIRFQMKERNDLRDAERRSAQADADDLDSAS